MVVSSRTGSQLAEVVAQVEKAGRRAWRSRPTSPTWARSPAWPTAREAFGRLDIVVNNVGGAMPAPSPRPRPATWRRRSTSTSPPPTPSPGLRCRRCWRAGTGRWSTSRRSWAGSAARATRPTAPPRRRCRTTPASPPATSPRVRVNAIGVGSVATSALDIVLDDESSPPPWRTRPRSRIGDIRHRGQRAVPRLGRRLVPHRQGAGGRRRARPAQPRPGLPDL